MQYKSLDTKKIVFGLLAAILMTVLLAGCGGNSNSSAENVESQANNAEHTADYPKKTIEVIVPAGAGGGTDVAARLVSQYLHEELGVSLVVVNVNGAGGTLGTRQVKDAEPDGYKVSFYNEGTILNEVMGVADYGMDAFKQAGIAMDVNSVALVSSSKFESFEAMMTYAEENPGKLKFGVEMGTYTQLLGEYIEQQRGVDLQLVDVGGVNAAIASLAGGHVDFIQSPLGVAKDYVESGEFNSLVVLGEQRYDKLQDIPTLQEQGVDFVLPKFYYFAFPKETPDEIVDVFTSALEKVTAGPAFAERAEGLYLTPNYRNPEDSIALFEKYKQLFESYQEQ
ncbi:tripartite tricarboxylate transporter substrate binding protein [Paenibacillus sp. IB182496]|uniref:Tripartite tricarboxylate transporter substrate binding protein n=1 Tax=Paenibacillus sabuli TaxID=2772509 RepID=A0A927BW88_9BACL|nr:tripartite tricarboxylate transporter substrate binding protein [Paenibacillus sabuli]MBD2846649.1 tripartite tricarboxylate transporter substrate binding protein [Paenibacillus sabuli]